MARVLTILFFILGVTACGPRSDYRTEYQKNGTYPISGGNCREPVASVITERNGRFDVAAAMGSAFLRDRERGLFATARHVVVLDIEYKLYLCGKVYTAHRKLDEGVTDVGFLIITSDFNPLDFPEPYQLGETPQKGDTAFIRGIHPHPKDLQENKIVHQIIEKYYNVTTGVNFKNSFQRIEFVYDDLPAKVVDLEAIFKNSSVEGMASEDLKDIVSLNFAVQADKDHIISFGGLSGGPTVNERGQVIGINSNGPSIEGKTVLERDGQLHYYPVVTLKILPVDELKRAIVRLNLSSR